MNKFCVTTGIRSANSTNVQKVSVIMLVNRDYLQAKLFIQILVKHLQIGSIALKI